MLGGPEEVGWFEGSFGQPPAKALQPGQQPGQIWCHAARQWRRKPLYVPLPSCGKLPAGPSVEQEEDFDESMPESPFLPSKQKSSVDTRQKFQSNKQTYVSRPPGSEATATTGHHPPILPGLQVRQPWWHKLDDVSSEASPPEFATISAREHRVAPSWDAGPTRADSAGRRHRSGTANRPHVSTAGWKPSATRSWQRDSEAEQEFTPTILLPSPPRLKRQTSYEILKTLTPAEKNEVSISWPHVAGNDRIILRGKLPELLHSAGPCNGPLVLSGKHRYQIAQEHVKAGQAVWRRSHNDLVRRKGTKTLNSSGSGSDLTCTPRHGSAKGPREAGGAESNAHHAKFSPRGTQVSPTAGESNETAMRRTTDPGDLDVTGPTAKLDEDVDVCADVAAEMLRRGRLSRSATDVEFEELMCCVCGATLLQDCIFCASCGSAKTDPLLELPVPPTLPEKSDKKKRQEPTKAATGRTPRSSKAPKGGQSASSTKSSNNLEQNVDRQASTGQKKKDGQNIDRQTSQAPKDAAPVAVAPVGSAESVTKCAAIDVRSPNFDAILELSRQYTTTVDEVKKRLDEFCSLNLTPAGTLTKHEFEIVIRQRGNIAEDEPIPTHLTLVKYRPGRKRPGSGDVPPGPITFEEYFLWALNTMYTEEILVPDRKERLLRSLAKDNGFHLTDVERVKAVFDRFDTDRGGIIDEDEFSQILILLMKIKNPEDMPVKRMKRYWAEVDKDGGGEVDFEEFLMWYYKLFGFGN